jgi:putative PIN family toxin of toxin-antitoxin system
MKPRVVLDCVVCLQGAARETGPAGACFRLMEEGAVTVCVNAQVLTAVKDVLTRPKVCQHFKTLTADRVDAFLRKLQTWALFVDPVPEVFTYPRDPDDQPYVNLAVAAGAKYLVTWDNDLLDLMADNPEGTAFRGRFPGLVILTPVAFLREQRQAPAAPSGANDGGENPTG